MRGWQEDKQNYCLPVPPNVSIPPTKLYHYTGVISLVQPQAHSTQPEIVFATPLKLVEKHRKKTYFDQILQRTCSGLTKNH